MTPQEELARYFEVCGYSPDDPISIVTRAAADGPLFWTTVTAAEAPRAIAYRSKINCWFSANPMSQSADKDSRGSAADVTAVRALWADLDIKDGGMPTKAAATAVMHEISALIGAKPVAVVWSGHGFQPRWKIDIGELHTPERMAPVLERFGQLVKLVAQRHGGAADSVYDLPRIIRAPHTTNIKPGLEPVATKVWLYDHDQTVIFERLLEVLEEYVPEAAPRNPAAPETESQYVGLERGNAYVNGALGYIYRELEDIASWPAGKTDDRGRGWEKIQADAALRMASLAKADWNSLTLEQAKALFVDHAPVDEGWTVRDVIKKWQSQEKRAEPADPPGDSDDPLSGGGGSPHLAAAREAAIWKGEDGGVGTGSTPGDVAVHGGSDTGPAHAPGEGGGDPEAAASRTLAGWRKYTWDDFGNADRTVALYGHELRYSPSMKRWLRYSDGAWRETETGGERAAQEMLEQLFRLEGPLYSDVEVRKGQKVSSERDDFHAWWTNQRTAAKVGAAAKVIRNSGRQDAGPNEFDAEPMLLNAPNGIIDLASGELLEHDPALMLRRQIPVKYDPDAKAPYFEAFLERVMPSVDMRDYLQRIVGYSLTGLTNEQVVFFHIGPPATGKSVFLRIMEAILGDFSRVVPPTTLLNKKMEQHPTDVMGMEGRRMLQVSETPEGARLDEALLKRLSGEETVSARGMGENFRDFRIVGKVHLVTNHPPHISDDPAVHRRLQVVPWMVQIPPEERNPYLGSQIILGELEGVLAWAVRGVQRWQEARLARPVEADIARSDYIRGEDEFAIFVEDELIVGAEGAFTESKLVYARYRQWSEGRGVKPMSAVAFGRKLSSRGIQPVRTKYARGFECHLQMAQYVPPDPLS